MASAGRILIMPKGEYDASTTYEMLDLVKHNGISWLAKKTVIGVEPSEDNSEYWHLLINIDLTSYAKKEDVDDLTVGVDSLKASMTDLKKDMDGLVGICSHSQVVSYQGSGCCSEENACFLTFDFEPKVLMMLGGFSATDSLFFSPLNNSNTRYNTVLNIVCDLLTTSYKQSLGFFGTDVIDDTTNYSYAKKSADGKTIYWYQSQHPDNANCHFNDANTTYYVLALG